MSENKVGNMTHNDLMSVLGTLLHEKLSFLATKRGFKLLPEELYTLMNENDSLRLEMLNLKNCKKFIVEKFNYLEEHSRRINLIFKSLKFNKGDDCCKTEKYLY